MVNNTEFIKRLEKILHEYELTAAGFAQKIAVGRASISHILSGRNKPSLDFVLKVASSFPEVDLYWLLLGQGSFPKKNEIHTPPTPVQIENVVQPISTESTNMSQKQTSQKLDPKKAIKKIVIFYDDNSFESFDN